MRRLIDRLRGFWALRSLAVGAVGTCVDLCVLFTGVELLGLPRVPCVAAGVSTGSLIGFLLNKYFAFKDTNKNVTVQGAKYLAVVLGELSLHSAISWTLIHRLGVYYVFAKFTADFLVMGCLNLVLLRYVVFPRRAAAPSLPSAPCPADGESDK